MKIKSLKEFLSYVGGVRLGNPSDNITPIASLGDTPPKGQGGKDSRGVGLQASKKYSKKEDGMVGPGMGTYQPFITAQKIKTPAIEPDKRSTGEKSVKEDLYSDDNPNDTVKGTGYGDAATARKTLKIIKSVDKKRQMQIVNTLYNRAKHHANQTADMRAAMSIFKTWIDDKKIKESILYKHMIDKKILKD